MTHPFPSSAVANRGVLLPVAAFALALMVLALLFRVGAYREALFAGLISLVCVVNGVGIASRIIRKPKSWMGFIASSYFVGTLSTSYVVGVMVLMFGWDIAPIVCILVATSTLSVLLAKSRRSYLRDTPVLDGAGLAIGLLVLGSAFLPLWNLGVLTDKGYAFASLFSHDFVYRIGYTAHVSRGLSSESVFMAGLNMPNQYLYYLYPAMIYRLSGLGADLISISKFICVLFSVFFPLLLMESLRQLGASSRAAFVCLLIAFVFYSLSGPVVMIMRFVADLQLGVLSQKVSSLAEGQTLISQGWLRDLLVEPHSVTVLAVAALCFVLSKSVFQERYMQGSLFVCAVFTSVCFGMDSFLSVVLGVWLACVGVVALVRHRDARKVVVCEALAAVVVGSCVLYSFYLMGIFDPMHSAGAIRVEPYYQMMVLLPVYLPIEYGIMVILSAVGCAIYLRGSFPVVVMAFILLLICLMFFLFAQHAEPNVVQRKSGKLMYLAMLMASVPVATNFSFGKSSLLSRAVWVVCGAVLALSFCNALLTVFIFSNVYSEKYASYVKEEDYEGVRWVVSHTPMDAVVQSLPEYYPVVGAESEGYRMSLFSQLGERRMALGDLKFAHYTQTESDTVRGRYDEVQKLFSAGSAKAAHSVAMRLRIDYVFVGTYEKTSFPAIEDVLDEGEVYFDKVYHHEGVSIFRVLDTLN